jgi:hypothetical protein
MIFFIPDVQFFLRHFCESLNSVALTPSRIPGLRFAMAGITNLLFPRMKKTWKSSYTNMQMRAIYRIWVIWITLIVIMDIIVKISKNKKNSLPLLPEKLILNIKGP